MLRPISARCKRGASPHQTNWSADTAGCFAGSLFAIGNIVGFDELAPIETNCAGVGSAQQYQGSLKNGTGTEELCGAGTGATIPAARCAACQILANASERESFCASALAAMF